MKVKMADVAKEANVSIATVARVVRENGYVSESVRQKVQEAINKLGYIAKVDIQTKNNFHEGLIGHIVPNSCSNFFFQMLSRSVNKAAYERGFHVLAVNSDEDISGIPNLIDGLIKKNVDAIIFSSFIQDDVPENLKDYMENLNIPVVMIERPAEYFGVDKVLVNNAEGTFIATNYLIEKGHKEIAYIGKNQVFNVEKERYSGYLMAMEKRDLEAYTKNHSYFVKEYSSEHGYQAAKRIFEEDKKPSAILVAADILSVGVLQYMYDRGIRVPEDISVIGHDDTVSEYLAPPLTTVRLPIEDMAVEAINMIMARKNDKYNNARCISISPKIVERRSVKDLTI